MSLEVVRSIDEMRKRSRGIRRKERTIGFVPTMGALHDGHLSLMRRSRSENDVSVISIYVNPAQFGPGEDLDRYPRSFEEDVRKAETAGVDIVFTTTDAEMYPEGFSTFVVEERITGPLCGASRPGHFRGVLTVVLKLFEIVRPHRAYFGEKDYQQFLAIRKMAADLDLDVAVVPCPIVREGDGLALSSRNDYLDPDERRDARVIPRALDHAESLVGGGLDDPGSLRREVEAIIRRVPSARVDYVEVRDPRDLSPLRRIEGDLLVALAVFIGETRLIDNRVIRPGRRL